MIYINTRHEQTAIFLLI